MRLLIAMILLTGEGLSAGPFRAGASAVVITPAAGSAMAGYFDQRLSEGVDDDLYARAIVIESGGAKAALVACDLVEMPRPIAQRARELIAHSTGIPPDHVMISATHCHTGPVVALEKSGPGERGT